MNWNLVVAKELLFYFGILMTNLVGWSLVCGAFIWIGEHAH